MVRQLYSRTTLNRNSLPIQFTVYLHTQVPSALDFSRVRIILMDNLNIVNTSVLDILSV